jgi:hypothetical protein
MNFRSLKLAGAAASILLLTVIPSQAFAEIDVLTGLSNTLNWRDATLEST